MSKSAFTHEQREALEANEYTRRVGDHYIRFTDAFWQEFSRRYLAGEDRYEICRSMRYDPKVISSKRLEYICRTIRDSQDLPASKRKRPAADTKYSEMPQEEAIKAMATELTYLRQEVEFLKKFRSLRRKTSSRNDHGNPRQKVRDHPGYYFLLSTSGAEGVWNSIHLYDLYRFMPSLTYENVHL